MARPTKYTEERAARIVTAIGQGATRRAAAQSVGVDDRTLYRWLERYASFADAIARAEAVVELRCTKLILEAAKLDARHAEWWLERRRPDDYGRRDRIEVSIRREAERLAGELGLDADEIIREAERLVARQ